jgi:uroporphyrinogen-III synthase
MLPLPATPYEACEKIAGASVHCRWFAIGRTTTRCPPQYGHRQVWVKGYVHEVVIACGSEVIARHRTQL